MSNSLSRISNKTLLIKWLVAIIIPLMMYFFIPISGIITAQVKMFFVTTVFCLCLIAMEMLPIGVIAALMPALWLFTGVAGFSVSMSPFLGTTIYMILGGFVMAATLNQSGLLVRVAYKVMIICSGSYTKLLIGVWLAGTVIMTLTFGSGYLIAGILAIGFVHALNLQNTRAAAGIGFAALVGGCTSKSYIYSASNYSMIMGMTGGLMDATKYTFEPLSVIFHNCPMFLVAGLMVLVVSKWYKPEVELDGKDYFIAKYNELGKITNREKWCLFIFAALVIFMISSPYHKLPTDYGFMTIPYLAFLPFVKAADAETLKEVSFEMLFFAVACMAIGTVATSLGLSQMVSIFAGKMLGGESVSMFKISAAVFAVVFILNFLMTPMAIWSLASAPIIGMALEMGLNPVPFVYMLISTAEAIIFPYEYVPYLILYGLGFMGMKDFIVLNVFRSGAFFIGFMVLLIPWWMLIGLL